VLLAVLVIGRREGLSGGELGLLLASFAACLLLGSILSSYVRRLLPVRGVLLLELWTWTGCALFLVWPNVFVLVASILPTALKGHSRTLAQPTAEIAGVGTVTRG
jgi:hypothetical protein